MLPLVRSALSRLSVPSVQRVPSSRNFQTKKSDFDDKFGLPIFLSGTLFCIATWMYTLAHYDLQHYVSPVGRVRPKEWKEE